MTEHLLQVKNFHLGFPLHEGGLKKVLQDVSFNLQPGESVALTGPSGCGKSMLARALCGLLPPNSQTKGDIFWRGKNLVDPESPQWQLLRGGSMTLILQEPATSLNPVMKVGKQIAESWALHHPERQNEALEQSLNLLKEVQLNNSQEISAKFPHQLSGGMRQRVLLAAALACEPQLLIADEPTTALDPTVQLEILALLAEIRKNRGMALFFISHDPDLVKLMTTRSLVIKDGRLCEGGLGGILPNKTPVGIFEELNRDLTPVLKARNLIVEYSHSSWSRGESSSNQRNRAVKNVDIDLFPGQTIGLTGESGSGKTSLAKALVGQIPVFSGTLRVAGFDLINCKGRTRQQARRAGQLVFQDPVASLNPRLRVGDMLIEAQQSTSQNVDNLLAEVGLGPELAYRYAHQLSGGQNQRVALARALAVNPSVLIADEVTSALDPEATGHVMSLLESIMNKRRLAVLHISHDLDLLHRWCQQIMVMYDGVILEVYPGLGQGKSRHPYTQQLLAARPNALRADQLQVQERNKYSSSAQYVMGQGCPWAPFCNEVISSCYKVLPPLVPVGLGHLSRCPVVNSPGSSTFIDT